MKYIHLLPLLLVLLLIGCKKKENDDPRPKCQTVLHAPQEFLDYWFFPKGSWWVYKLKGSNPAAYDTVTFTAHHTAFYAEPYEYIEISDPCQMVYSYGLFHSNREHFAFPSTAIGVEGLRGYKFGNKWVLEQYWDHAQHANEGYVFFYPFSIGEELNSTHNYVADTNAVTTPLGTFPNSVGMFLGYDYNPDTSAYPQRRIHLTKGVGITKRRYYNNQVWELVNYHINQ